MGKFVASNPPGFDNPSRPVFKHPLKQVRRSRRLTQSLETMVSSLRSFPDISKEHPWALDAVEKVANEALAAVGELRKRPRKAVANLINANQIKAQRTCLLRDSRPDSNCRKKAPRRLIWGLNSSFSYDPRACQRWVMERVHRMSRYDHEQR